MTDGLLSRYSAASIDEAITIVDFHRKAADLMGGPEEVSKYNVWTRIKRDLTALKEEYGKASGSSTK